MLFAEIVGFDEIATRRDPEQAYAVVTGCLGLLDAVCRRHGGSVDKYLGDALMAVFGHPVPSARHQRSAVDAALEMRRRVADYRRELALDGTFDVRIGLNSGSLIAGDVAGEAIREFRVLGDAVNVSARLEQNAPLGAIYVGAGTRDATVERFDYRSLGAMQLKGKEVRVETYELLGARAGGSGREEEVFAAPLAGREPELAQLCDAVEALEAGHGDVIVIQGASGTGKSRLAGEMRLRAEERGIDVREVRGSEQTDAHLHAFDGWLEAPPGERPPTRASAESPVAAVRARLEETFTDGRPHLFVVEDFEELDPASLEVVAELAPLCREHPLVLVLLAGADDRGEHANLAALRERCGELLRELLLEPLDPAASQALLDALERDEPIGDAARALILERAAGNPGRLILGAFLAPALASEADQTRDRGERTGETERRRATVLFADLSGFTTLTEKLGDAQAYDIVTGCLAALDEVALKHGGTVDKHLGDCVMALFGVPRAIEEASRAAVNAAIDMRHRVHAFNQERALAHPLDVHIGIDTGLGISGEISGPLLREYALMGNSVSLASYLKDVAPNGKIWVGEETYRATREHFEYRGLAPIHMEGRTDPAHVFQVESEEAKLHRRGSSRQLFSTLVGRDAELAEAEAALGALLEGRGGILSVVGVGGLGKSRLIDEIATRPQARRARWLEGRSLSVGAGLGYHPFADLLRAWAGIGDQEEGLAASRKLEDATAKLAPAEVDDLFPLLATIAGLPLSSLHAARLEGVQGEALEKLLRRAVAQLLELLSDQEPLVLLFEDLHWADISSIELLETLLDQAASRRILFLLALRPKYPETGERVREYVREHHADLYREIELHPLDRAATRDLLDNLFRNADVPHASRVMMEDRAAGNPFFLEEVVRSLLDAGALVMRRGEFRATEKIRSVVLPGTIQELIMARVDRLRTRPRSMLQIASVIGGTFTPEVLERVADDPTDSQEALDVLSDAEFLAPTDPDRRVEYTFKQPVIQEVVYDSLVQDRREELHRRVGAAIETASSEQSAGSYAMLAYHYSMGKDHERAEENLFRAGDAAARSAASNEALRFFREASDLYFQLHGEGGDPEKKALLQKNLALAFFNRGRFIEATSAFNRALGFLGEWVPDTPLGVAAYAARHVTGFLAGLYLPSLRRRPAPNEKEVQILDLLFRRAQAETTASPTRFLVDSLGAIHRLQDFDLHSVERSGVYFSSAVGIFSFGGLSFRVSERLLDTSRDLVQPGDPREQLLYRLWSYLHHLLAGSWDQAPVVDAELIETNLRLGQLWEVTTYLGLRTEQLLYQGRFDEAEDHLQQIAKLEDLYAYDLAKSNRQGVGGFLEIERRRLDRASARIREYYGSHDENLLNLLALSSLVKIRTLQGQRESAAEHLETATKLERESRPVPPFHLGHYLQARLRFEVTGLEEALAAGDRAAARRLGRAAARTARRGSSAAARMAWRRPEIQRLRGTACWLRGRRRAALRWWERSAAEAERLDMRPELARTLDEATRRARTLDPPPERVCGATLAETENRAAALFAELSVPSDAGETSRSS